MPANAVCKANNAALLILVSDGTYPVECAFQPHAVITIKWVAVCIPCKSIAVECSGDWGLLCNWNLVLTPLTQ